MGYYEGVIFYQQFYTFSRYFSRNDVFTPNIPIAFFIVLFYIKGLASNVGDEGLYLGFFKEDLTLAVWE